MPRPTSKTQLLDQTRQGYAALQALIAPLSAEEQTDPNTVGEWSVKDVLAHLLAWQGMVRSWYQQGKVGETPITPAEGYTWQQIPALNQAIYTTYRDQPLASIQQTFAESHQATLDLIESLSDAEMFTPKVYVWTKSTTLGSYLTSATSSHYEWALKEIRRGIKAKRKQLTEQ